MSGTSEPSKSGEHSTPHSKNVSAASQAIISATIDELDPSTVNDMKNEHTVYFDKFLLDPGADRKAVLDKNGALIAGLSGDQFVSPRKKGYGEKHNETALYGPLSNYIVSKFDNGKIVLDRNDDANYISWLGGNSRGPVVVALDKGNDPLANDRWKDFNASEPTDVEWTWSDFRNISEFNSSKHAKPNILELTVKSELSGGAGSSSESKTKVGAPVLFPKGSHWRKGTRNRFPSDKLGDLLGEGSSRQRVLVEEFKPDNHICHCQAYEYPIPLCKVTEISDFKQAVRDTVLGHHLLASSSIHILHRDISIRNLMIRVRDGIIRGVLNDWDLAEMESNPNDGYSGERTGTRPYMAVDLLVPLPPRHLERFDWESFFCVICMISCRYDKGEDKNPDALPRWYNTDDVLLRAMKFSAVTGFTNITQDATDFYRQLVLDWIKPLQNLFADGYLAQSQHSRRNLSAPLTDEVPFDDETLGGHVTYEKIWEILQK